MKKFERIVRISSSLEQQHPKNHTLIIGGGYSERAIHIVDIRQEKIVKKIVQDAVDFIRDEILDLLSLRQSP